MSQENVEIVRKAFEAFRDGVGRGDPGAVFDSAVVAADAEFIPIRGYPGPPSYRGREAFVEFWRTWTEEFDRHSITTEQLIEAPSDRVVGLTHQVGTGKASGTTVEAHMAIVYELEGGQVVRMRVYVERTEAFKAVGLSE
jgi:ketosteroid isomerase-like protein